MTNCLPNPLIFENLLIRGLWLTLFKTSFALPKQVARKTRVVAAQVGPTLPRPAWHKQRCQLTVQRFCCSYCSKWTVSAVAAAACNCWCSTICQAGSEPAYAEEFLSALRAMLRGKPKRGKAEVKKGGGQCLLVQRSSWCFGKLPRKQD